MRIRLAPLTLGLLVAASPATALRLLTHGKEAVFRDRPGVERDSAELRFTRNRALAPLVDPTCAAGNASSLQISSYSSATGMLVPGAVTPLRCESWRAPKGGGFVYKDRPGTYSDVRKIVYRRDRLVIRVRGGTTYQAVVGPVGYVEAWLGLGAERLLARFHNFRRNEPAIVATRVPNASAAEGEAAFWDVLWGDEPSESRQAVALHCLELAIGVDPRDGHSLFLLGMMRFYRFTRMTPDLRAASDLAKRTIRDADANLAAAVPLLWKDGIGDSRIPGFAAAAKYAHGIVDADAALAAQGLAELETAIALNPLFNALDFLGVVPSTIAASDPLYTRVLELVDFALDADNRDCVTSQPEVCGNAGMAPHNLEGALLLFGDLYAKGGVLDDPDPLRGARNLYAAAAAFGPALGWNATFQALASERLATADARVALHLNADPADDPLLIGNGPGEGCATCHRKQ